MRQNNTSNQANYPKVDENGDFIWRFKLDVSGNDSLSSDGLVECFRSQLDELLKIIVLTKDGKRIRPNGFKFISDQDREYKIW